MRSRSEHAGLVIGFVAGLVIGLFMVAVILMRLAPMLKVMR